MRRTYEVAVVGAGMFGSAAAKYLARAGVDVLLIGPGEPVDAAERSQYTFSAHFDEARITRRLGWDEVWATTDTKSQERFRDIEATSGVDFFYECGSLVLVARSMASRTEAMLERGRTEGIAIERLSEDTMRSAFPELGALPMAGGIEGLFEREGAGYLNPRRLVHAQIELASKAGAELRRDAVVGLRRDEETGVWSLRTGGGDIADATRVLVATGAFTNHNHFLPAGRMLALHAFGEPNLLFEIDDEQLDRMRELPAIVSVDPADNGDANLSLYVLPPIRYPDGRWYLRIGPGMQPFVEGLHDEEAMTHWYATQEITPRQTDALTAMMRLMIPDLQPVSVRAASCIIEKTPTRFPYIGHVGDDVSYTVAIGGNGHGARGSDEIGRLAALTVLDECWDSTLDPAIFAPLFADGQVAIGETRPDFLKPPFGLC